MEAVAKDILFGPFLAFVARGTFGDNPVAAVLVTWTFVEVFLLMGALNTIAPVKFYATFLELVKYSCQCQAKLIANEIRVEFKLEVVDTVWWKV